MLKTVVSLTRAGRHMAELLTATTEKRRSGANVVKLRGVISGSSELHTIDIGTTPKLMINLAQVDRFEASGQRDWSQWITSLVARNIRVELVSCSPAIVGMLNKDVEFAGKAVVKSVNARFTCAGCDSTADVLATIIDLRESKSAPSRDCDLCNVPMSMIDDPKTYFAFVAKLPVPTKDSAPEIPHRPSESRIARGSHQSVAPQTQGNTERTSHKLVERRSSMSAFQVNSRGSRPSGLDISTGPTPRVDVVVNSRAYWIIAIVLLALAAAVLAILLMVM
jgi:hypothetical protein